MDKLVNLLHIRTTAIKFLEQIVVLAESTANAIEETDGLISESQYTDAEHTRVLRITRDELRDLETMVEENKETAAEDVNTTNELLSEHQDEDENIEAEHVRFMRILRDDLDKAIGEYQQVTLTNSYAYPHNNSISTIQLETRRTNTQYAIWAEVVSVTGGAVGNIEFSDKLVNGFKVEFTGSASKVVLNLHIQGDV